ncbi:MAG: hypothetical protein ACYTFI_11265 [Planctomycetota bacterium]|jgi:hypothetical protein
MFDARFFEQVVPSCIEAMCENFEIKGEIAVVVHLSSGETLIANSVLQQAPGDVVALGCVFPAKKGDNSTRMTTVCVPVKSIVRVDLMTHPDNPKVTGKQRKFMGYISRRKKARRSPPAGGSRQAGGSGAAKEE